MDVEIFECGEEELVSGLIEVNEERRPAKLSKFQTNDDPELTTLSLIENSLQPSESRRLFCGRAIGWKPRLDTIQQELESLRNQMGEVGFQDEDSPPEEFTDVLKQWKVLQRYLDTVESDRQEGDIAQVENLVQEVVTDASIPKNVSVAGQGDTRRIRQLEERLTKLETALGSYEPSKISPYSTLTKAVDSLQMRTKLLSETDVTLMRVRAQKILRETEKIEQLEKNSDSANLKKLLNSIEKWDEMGTQIPEIVDRLKSLREVHDSGVSALDRLTVVEKVSKEVKNSLSRTDLIVDQLRESMQSNWSTLQGNLTELQARISQSENKQV